MLERAGTAVKETAIALVGKKREVLFKSKVEDAVVNEGLSREEAERAIFEDSLTDCLLESSRQPGENVDPLDESTRRAGVIDLSGENFKQFETGMKQLISKPTLKEFRKNGDENRDFRALDYREPTGEDLLGAQEFFEERFGGKAPCPEIIERYSERQMQIQALMGRIKQDIASVSLDVYNPDTSEYVSANLEQVLKDFPEIGADMGKLLACKERIAAIEKQFARRIAYEKSADGINEQLKEIKAQKPMKRIGNFLGSQLDIVKAGGKTLMSAVSFGYAAFKMTASILTLNPVIIARSGFNTAKKGAGVIKSGLEFGGAVAMSVVEFAKLLPPAARATALATYNIPKTLMTGANYKARGLMNKDMRKI
jgi:hypothetical protein